MRGGGAVGSQPTAPDCIMSIQYILEPETAFKEKHGIMRPMQDLAITHLISYVNFVVSYPTPYKGKGVEWGRSLLLVEHIFICLLISKTGFLCKQKYREGGGKG